MKIALLDSEATLGGAQRGLLDLARGLLARRWDVMVVLGQAGPLYDACTRQFPSLPVEIFPMADLGVPTVLRLRHLLKQHGVRMVLANSSRSTLLGAAAVRLLHGQACWRISTVNDMRQSPFRLRVNSLLCSTLLLSSPAIRDEYTAQRGPLAKACCAPPVIDVVHFPASAPPIRRSSERPVAGMIAPWEPLSGHDVVMKAFRTLHSGGRAARLRLAALDPPTADQERYQMVVLGGIKAAGLADRVFIDGETHDIQTFLARCDVIVAPYLRESSGRLALEVAASGRPIIASRCSGMQELIEDGHTGLLVPPNNPQALADALALLLASPALRAEMGRQARIRVEERYSVKVLLDLLERRLGISRPEAMVSK